jgi:cysteinyl-tRNA synthetase
VKARQEHLFNKYLNEPKTATEIQKNLNDAKNLIETKRNKPDQEPDKKTMYLKQINVADEVLDAIRGIQSESHTDFKEYVIKCKDVLSQWLDDKLGNLVSDNSIFSTLPRNFEKSFHEDMQALNVRLLNFFIDGFY